mmetsp:Transcript_1477/g.3459  ORF Transcript_1477/g.3459 Transcript_1477/m.3459 type:complete len:215 (-) Transcript_1477:2106-2750(-)
MALDPPRPMSCCWRRMRRREALVGPSRSLSGALLAVAVKTAHRPRRPRARGLAVPGAFSAAPLSVAPGAPSCRARLVVAECSATLPLAGGSARLQRARWAAHQLALGEAEVSPPAPPSSRRGKPGSSKCPPSGTPEPGRSQTKPRTSGEKRSCDAGNRRKWTPAWRAWVPTFQHSSCRGSRPGLARAVRGPVVAARGTSDGSMARVVFSRPSRT